MPWIDLKLGGCILYEILQAQLNFGHTWLNSCIFLASIYFSSFSAFAEKLLIGLRSDLVDELNMRLASQFWLTFGHVSLNSVFSGLWLVEQFLHICRQTADQIELKSGGFFGGGWGGWGGGISMIDGLYQDWFWKHFAESHPDLPPISAHSNPTFKHSGDEAGIFQGN